MDAIAACSVDGKHLVIKAVNYENNTNTLLVRLQGSKVSDTADIRIFTVRAGLTDQASIDNQNIISPVESSKSYAKDMSFEIEPYSVVVIEILMK
ncbi:MAG: hypothetical protein MUC95_10920 [Spirochaetes bacterium]|nr:hypothetical protein [Spirochaetota bacterium]